MKRTGPTNIYLRKLISELKKAANINNAPIWDAVAEELERPTRKRRVVNLSHINKVANENETILVPGKVLGTGDLTKQLTIAAWKFSDSAVQKILNSKGKILSIPELIKKVPTGKGVRIIG